MTASLLALVLAAECADCHKVQAAAFAASKHVTASREPVYAVSFQQARSPWCLECHQPERSSRLGLTCQSCHRVKGDEGAVLGAHEPRGISNPHRIVVDPTLATSSCLRCHEFNVPFLDRRDPIVSSSKPMQTTVTEMLGNDPRAQCSDCHDSHRALGAHDLATVRSALRFSAHATADGAEVRVAAVGVSHRFPTGDSFRRLVVTVCDDEPCAVPLGQQELGPFFEFEDGVYVPKFDRTLHDGEERVLRFPRARWWRAQFFYGNPKFDVGLKPREISVEVARGALVPQP